MQAAAKTYQLKPQPIEALQFNCNYAELAAFCPNSQHRAEYGTCWIPFPNGPGQQYAGVGDWIVKDADGKFHVIKHELFVSMYETGE